MNTRYEIFIKKILTGLPNSELSKLVNEKKKKYLVLQRLQRKIEILFLIH